MKENGKKPVTSKVKSRPELVEALYEIPSRFIFVSFSL
jgi:hypothetical protein